MQLFKKIVLWFAIVLAVILIAAVTVVPRYWSVTRETVINTEPRSIYPWLADIEKWREWNAFSLNDPDIAHTYPTTTSGVGAEDHWTSKKFGNGSALITKADTATGIEFNLYFQGRDAKATPGAFVFTPVEGGTKVVYTVNGDNGFNPAYRIMSLFMGGFMGEFFEQSLAKIKELAEANPVPEPMPPMPDSLMADSANIAMP
jgi:uncharacterized protein YndB with AHSA1/START domain